MTKNDLRRSVYRASLLGPDYFVVRHLNDFLVRHLRKRCHPGIRVADVGCGEQPYRDLIQRSGADYIGVDIEQNQKGTVDLLGSITNIPADDETFDLILCSEVLEHVVDSAQAFAELSRILRTGGCLILTTPFAYPLHEEPHDFVRLTPYAILSLAERCSLRRIEFEQTGNELEVLATVWCNLWSRLELLPLPARRRVAGAMRFPVNLIVAFASRALGRRLPGKYYLSNASLFEKLRDGAVSTQGGATTIL